MSYALQKAVLALKAGELLAYPTEAVFGLGCDIDNRQALKKLRQIKGRGPNKGFIVLFASIEQLQGAFPALSLSTEQIKQIQSPCPHPTTWLLPFSKNNKPKVARLLVGSNHSIAVRIPQHPIALALCEKFGPIVSSSANVSKGLPAKNIMIVRKNFRAKIGYYLTGKADVASSPSQIIDIQSGRIVRAAQSN